MNAFGDLLKNITWQGQTTHETELEMLLNQQGIQTPVQQIPIQKP